MMKTIGRIMAKLFILALVLGVVYLVVYETPLFRVSNIVVNGHKEVSYNEILQAADLEMNRHILSINSKTVVDGLRSHSWIKDAKITKQYPNTIILEVLERKPLVVLEYSSNYLVLDRELIVLEAGANERELYIINGISFKNFSIGNEIVVSDEYLLRNTIDLIELIEKSHITFMPMILVGDSEIELRISEKMFAKFGTGENIEKKFNSFLDVYEDLRSKGVDAGLIDLRFKGAPTVDPIYGEE